MKPGRLHMSYQWLRMGYEELRLVKSLSDLKALVDQAWYGLLRTTGTLDRHTSAPHSLQLEPTNCCNLNCICCSRARSTRVQGYMDFDLFRRIIDDASEAGVKKIRLYLHGEPLLHPRITDMFGYIKKAGLAVHLVTNGMLFTQDRSEALLSAGPTRADRVIFSILGYSPQVHESIMRGVNHERVLNNLFALLQLRPKGHPTAPVIETVFYVMPENDHEQEAFFKSWHGVVDHVQVVPQVSRQFARFKEGGTHCTFTRRKTCVYLWDRMTVFWNGDVTTCMADLDGIHHLGNLREQSICKVWNSREARSIKELHKKRLFDQLPLCGQCDW
jgi:radical SAM protein with 4Fe4S-binding SPASM domain